MGGAILARGLDVVLCGEAPGGPAAVMDDTEFITRLKEKIEASSGVTIDFEVDHDDKQRFDIDFSDSTPKVTFGSEAITNAGLARMFSQYAILCLKEGREVGKEEFLLYLRRN